MSVPLEHASVRINTSLKALVSIETRPLNNVLLNHTQLGEEGSGRQSFPCPPSPSNLQSNLAGRLSFPSITYASTYKALDLVKVAAWAATLVFSPVCLPVTLDKNTSHQPATQSMYATAPMPQPVTTIYDSLTTGKLP